jgi:dihydrofolate synthase/folylpolyglutamate synthase
MDPLDWLFGRVNYERATPRPGALSLDRMRGFLARLGDPHRRLRIVHITGTKGKGSVAATLASVLRAAGYRTGLFTSPHLVRFEERFQIDNEPISPGELAALIRELQPVVEHLDRKLPESLPPWDHPVTFFEMTTALGFLHFVRRRADVAVVEVGLGGRFDATNVCTPVLAVLTSVSYDHTRILGDRLPKIAFEKAGIVKPGVPTVSGITDPESRAVVEQVCRARGSPLVRIGSEFTYDYEPGLVSETGTRPPRVRVRTPTRHWPTLELSLLGAHQGHNAAVAVAGIEILRQRGFHLPDEAVQRGLRQVAWPARMELIRFHPLVILDCAHNVASAEALVETLQTSILAGRNQPPRQRLLIFGGSADKDLAGMLRVLAPHFTHAFLTRHEVTARAVPPETLASLLRSQSDLPCTLCPTPVLAWELASTLAGPDDLICITGSVYLAGDLRPLLLKVGR